MKTGVFVEGLSNVQRFLNATRALDARGAGEACWMLAEGEPGFGKTNTLIWYAAKRTPAFLRAKRDWTPNWMLRDFAAVLKIAPVARTEALFNAVVSELMQHSHTIIVDEGDHAAASVRVLETLRDITDTAETPLTPGVRGQEAGSRGPDS